MSKYCLDWDLEWGDLRSFEHVEQVSWGVFGTYIELPSFLKDLGINDYAFRIFIQLHRYENKFFGMSNLYAKSLEPKWIIKTGSDFPTIFFFSCLPFAISWNGRAFHHGQEHRRAIVEITSKQKFKILSAFGKDLRMATLTAWFHHISGWELGKGSNTYGQQLLLLTCGH